MPARDIGRLRQEIAEAKRHLRLPADCRAVSCYEAGRDGFWLHRCLAALEIQVDRHLPKRLKELRQWDGGPLPPALHQRLLREVRQLEQQRARTLRNEESPAVAQVRKLLGLRGIDLRRGFHRKDQQADHSRLGDAAMVQAAVR